MPDTTLESLEKQKGALIARVLELQELADSTNEKIYQLTIQIEQLNLKIGQARQAAPTR